MGKQAPAPGNYTGAAEQTAQANAANVNAQTQANRPNISTPFGNQQWVMGPNGQWQMNTSMSPEVQAALAQMRGTPVSGDAARQQTIDSAWSAAQSRLNPMFAQREGALSQQLANQGLDMNSQAARSAQRQLGQQRNDAYSSALAGAISEGNRAGSDVFRNNLMARNLPLSDLQGAMGLLSMPSFMGAGAAQGPNYLQAMGMQDQAALQKWQLENQANADAWGAGLGLLGDIGGAALFKFSDARLKTDIVRGGEAAPGIPWATWKWADTGASDFGVIAQDVEKVRPDCVAMHPNGFLMVDYQRLLCAEDA